MHSSGFSMGYSEKKISINALVAMVLGMVLSGLQAGLVIASILYKGKLPLLSGVLESYILLFGLFGLLWAILSLDDEKTIGKYKYGAIAWNGVALVSAGLVMALGVLN